MKKISAAKARCLRLADHVQSTREPLVVTKKGLPVAKLAPTGGKTKNIFGRMRAQVQILGDIVSPASPLEDWAVLR